MPDQRKVTYIRSSVGRPEKQKRTIRALGFKKLHQSRLFDWTPQIRGMVNKVNHLVKIEMVEGQELQVTEVSAVDSKTETVELPESEVNQNNDVEPEKSESDVKAEEFPQDDVKDSVENQESDGEENTDE